MSDVNDAKLILDDMEELVNEFSDAPTLETMKHRTLDDKLIAGPTSAHVIEEVHTPLNFAYVTFTTGSTAFQNIVGVTHQELPERVEAGVRALRRAGAREGDSMVVCYPPLINVFSRGAVDEMNITPHFLPRSSRDAFLVTLCKVQPRIVIGESSFLRASLEDAKKLGLWPLIPENMILLCAGTPLDLELPEVAEQKHASVNDLYGCQEFGWVTINGVPVRDDVEMVPDYGHEGWQQLVVGGLPTGDSFPISDTGHLLDPEGKIITYSRRRSTPEYDVVVRACTAQSAQTVERASRTILRIKGRVVRLAPDMEAKASENVLELRPAWPAEGEGVIISGPEKTKLFQRMIEAQQASQSQSKSDPLWLKKR